MAIVCHTIFCALPRLQLPFRCLHESASLCFHQFFIPMFDDDIPSQEQRLTIHGQSSDLLRTCMPFLPGLSGRREFIFTAALY